MKNPIVVPLYQCSFTNMSLATTCNGFSRRSYSLKPIIFLQFSATTLKTGIGRSKYSKLYSCTQSGFGRDRVKKKLKRVALPILLIRFQLLLLLLLLIPLLLLYYYSTCTSTNSTNLTITMAIIATNTIIVSILLLLQLSQQPPQILLPLMLLVLLLLYHNNALNKEQQS